MCMCKCNNENCVGYYLLHPAEFHKIDDLMEVELKLHTNAKFELIESPSSGETYLRFKELHVSR